MNLIVLGPAGSGKSTLVSSLSEYLKSLEYEVKLVNLDPASPPIYKADKDVRNFVKTEDIMKAENLGINGALVKSMELSSDCVDRLLTKADFTLYDTPGQMELFIYLNSGIEIARKIAEFDNTVCLFVVDSAVASTPENFVSILAQNAVVSLRMEVPTLTVFNKIDISKLLSLTEVKSALKSGESMLSELMEGLLDFLEVTTVRYRTIGVSALHKKGLDELFDAIKEVFCSCGDLS